jgi:hypothetical protein
MSAPTTTAFALDGRIALSTAVIDRPGTSAEPTVVRRAVDLAVGAVSVLGASDGIHVGDETTAVGALSTGALGLLRAFDGTGRLYDADTTIFSAIDLSGDAPASTALTLYYDVAPDPRYEPKIPITGRNPDTGVFWLPDFLSGFNLEGNAEARSLSPFSASSLSGSRNFLVP